MKTFVKRQGQNRGRSGNEAQRNEDEAGRLRACCLPDGERVVEEWAVADSGSLQRLSYCSRSPSSDLHLGKHLLVEQSECDHQEGLANPRASAEALAVLERLPPE